jgi:hypothetical protein
MPPLEYLLSHDSSTSFELIHFLDRPSDYYGFASPFQVTDEPHHRPCSKIAAKILAKYFSALRIALSNELQMTDRL